MIHGYFFSHLEANLFLRLQQALTLMNVSLARTRGSFHLEP